MQLGPVFRIKGNLKKMTAEKNPKLLKLQAQVNEVKEELIKHNIVKPKGMVNFLKHVQKEMIW